MLSGADDLHSVVVSAESDAVAACTTTDEAWKRPETRLWLCVQCGRSLVCCSDVNYGGKSMASPKFVQLDFRPNMRARKLQDLAESIG